jgi:hypothetical protein
MLAAAAWVLCLDGPVPQSCGDKVGVLDSLSCVCSVYNLVASAAAPTVPQTPCSAFSLWLAHGAVPWIGCLCCNVPIRQISPAPLFLNACCALCYPLLCIVLYGLRHMTP